MKDTSENHRQFLDKLFLNLSYFKDITEPQRDAIHSLALEAYNDGISYLAKKTGIEDDYDYHLMSYIERSKIVIINRYNGEPLDEILVKKCCLKVDPTTGCVVGEYEPYLGSRGDLTWEIKQNK